ncbi:MAG TPA: FkbM family methyltransferase [Puia sp.]|uniref:FkbM family methyltransferase n=1 Tax=Puia sp. TaxID=2045100 RepID=UPI002BB60925|nr:FkbM family methyltransferase [Puia sp.]HVU96488.1 FkbM family methyltransferase [Puia sp.]
MPLLNNLIGGVRHRVNKLFHRPYRAFGIGWFEEKKWKHQKDNREVKQHVYKDRYTICFRDASEFLVSVDELFIKEFYKFRPQIDRPRIIDCGSYIGTSILYFKTNYPNAIVTGFEPDALNFALLQRNLENWGFEDTTAVNAAVWIHNEGISFNSAGNMSSRITGESAKAGMEKANTVRLRELLNEPVDFLKIDIEGAELPVLKDCSDKLTNVRNLFIEYHGRYERSSDLNQILDILARNGFEYAIKDGGVIHARPFWDKDTDYEFDLLLNIFAFRP